jgi:hypothetical protein
LRIVPINTNTIGTTIGSKNILPVVIPPKYPIIVLINALKP